MLWEWTDGKVKLSATAKRPGVFRMEDLGEDQRITARTSETKSTSG